MKAILSLVAAALLTPILAQDLSFEVPPPTCLNNCIHQYGACNLCMPANVFTECIQKTCGYQDESYASAYYGSICSSGGYVSYDSGTPTDFYIASSNQTICPIIPAATNCDSSTSSRRSRILQA
ncbi:MAG: hypothetical protein LQ340_007703 [Diploschistes diacapsis]|nr:MAG: hypothetical protein LQ340_007703 [Diploschistes diacapsis]